METGGPRLVARPDPSSLHGRRPDDSPTSNSRGCLRHGATSSAQSLARGRASKCRVFWTLAMPVPGPNLLTFPACSAKDSASPICGDFTMSPKNPGFPADSAKRFFRLDVLSRRLVLAASRRPIGRFEFERDPSWHRSSSHRLSRPRSFHGCTRVVSFRAQPSRRSGVPAKVGSIRTLTGSVCEDVSSPASRTRFLVSRRAEAPMPRSLAPS